MRKNSIQFIFFSLLSLSFFLLFVKLSHWQYQRAEQKKYLEQQIASLSSSLKSIQQVKSAHDINTMQDYSLVKLSGYWDSSHSLLLANKYNNHRPGYHLLTPLILDTTAQKTIVFINRGWADGEAIHSLNDPQGLVTVIGLLKNPHSYQYIMGNNVLPAKDRFPVIQRIDFTDKKLQKLIDYPSVAHNIVLLLRPLSPNLIVNWDVTSVSPIKHQGYAIQWLLLAITVVLLYSYLFYKTYKI